MGALAFAVIRACNVPNLEKQATTAAYGVTKIARGANAAARDSNAMTGSRALSTFRVVSPFRHSELFECFSKFGAELTRAARESQLEMRVQIKSHTIKSSL